MLSSALAYFLTLFLAFTIIPLVAVLLRLILIAVFSRLYWLFNKNPSPAALLQFSVRIAHPVGFLTSIFHGYTALWMGVVLLKGLDVQLDWFLPIILATAFVLWGIRRIQNPAEVKVNNKLTTTNSQGEKTTIILNPEDNDSNMDMDSAAQQEAVREKIKEKASEFMQGNTIIGLIGKVTGVLLATFHIIFPQL